MTVMLGFRSFILPILMFVRPTILEVVQPVDNPVYSLEGEPLVLNWTTCVDYYDGACRWYYNNWNTEFLFYSTYEDRVDVIEDIAVLWNFTIPQNPCSGGIEMAHSGANNSGSYWMKKGEGVDSHISPAVEVIVLQAADLSYVIEVGSNVKNISIAEGLNHVLPTISSGKIKIRVQLSSGFPSSTSYVVKRSGEMSCTNVTECSIMVDQGTMSDLLVVINTDISGVDEITILQPLQQAHTGNLVGVIVLTVICIPLLVCCVYFVYKYICNKRSDEKKKNFHDKKYVNVNDPENMKLTPKPDREAQATSLKPQLQKELQELKNELSSLKEPTMSILPPRDRTLPDAVMVNYLHLDEKIQALRNKMEEKKGTRSAAESKQISEIHRLMDDAKQLNDGLQDLKNKLDMCYRAPDFVCDVPTDREEDEDHDDTESGIEPARLHAMCMETQKRISAKRNANMDLQMRKYKIRSLIADLQQLGTRITAHHEATERLQKGWEHLQKHPGEDEKLESAPAAESANSKPAEESTKSSKKKKSQFFRHLTGK